ncbi:MAG: porin family protein [Bacteroidales bacterium]|jgi:opacity protein-like surface antigen|nr:porin family protein [Bacteroidales bacterium]
MKKIIFTLVLVSFGMMSQAQIFVGGQLGFTSDKTKDVEKTSMLTIAPMVGYQLSDKLAAGVRLNFTSVKGVQFKFMGSDDDLIIKAPLFGAELFAQYTFLSFGKFSVYADAGIGFGAGKGKVEFGDTKEDQSKVSIFGINVVPVLAYNLSEKITLLANLNFLELGFMSTTEKDLTVDPETKTTTTHFGLGVNTNNVASTGLSLDPDGNQIGSPITIGFIYKF